MIPPFDKLITIDRNFQTAVNLRLDRENDQKFTGYIPTASSAALMKQLFRNLADGKGKSASVIIGPYGKGKSHLLLVLLALLEGQYPEKQEEVLLRIGQIDGECERTARKVLGKGTYFTVLIADNGSGLNASLLLALKEALERKGILSLMPDSYFTEAAAVIDRWEKEFPETYAQLDKALNKLPQFAGHKNPVGELRTGLDRYEESALETFREIYPSLTSGTSFDPLINMEAVMLYRQVNHRLRQQYGYQGMYLVFDEFSKYLEGHSESGFAGDMKILQDMCELANASSEEENLFITFVAHKSLREYNGRYTKAMQNQFRGVEGRLQEYLFVDSAQNHFDLVRNVLKKKENFDAAYESIRGDNRELLEKSYQLPYFHTRFSAKEYEEIVAKGCFPLTPMTAVLLLYLCEKAAQNERTLFTFLANDEHNSVYEVIHRKGRRESSYLGAALLYDYFAPIFRESADVPEIHQEWLKAEYALKQTEEKTEREVIKTIAILQIAGNRQEFPVQAGMIALAMGRPAALVEQVTTALVQKQLLIWRSRLGCYAFKNNIGINLDAELEEAIQKLPSKTDFAAVIPSMSELEYLLPKSYNQQYSITRYFQYVYLPFAVLQQITDPQYLFREKFSDGKLIALVEEESIDEEAVREKSRQWMENRVLILLPNQGFTQKNNVRKVLALRNLLQNRELMEENPVAEQELKLYLEDVLFEINAALEQDFLPQNANCRIIWQGECREFSREKEFNAFLSGICETYYAFSPKVNHELLNIQEVSGQYLKARNHVVADILEGNSLEHYERGTGPEALIYRTALVRTGVLGKQFPRDTGTDRILSEIRRFIQNSAEERQCFSNLYGRLLGEGFGVRKGVLPLFLALEYTAVAGTPILYLQAKEMPVSADIVNNINERPEQYFLYLEKVDGEKEAYLSELENFLKLHGNGQHKQQRIQLIAEALQRKYRALPKAASNWKEYDAGEWSETAVKLRNVQGITVEKNGQQLHEVSVKLMGLLRRMEVNARELLFERIPGWLGKKQADVSCAFAVECICRVWQMRVDYICKSLEDRCLMLWGGRPGENLAAYLSGWYRNLDRGIEQAVFTSRTAAFQKCLKHMETGPGEELICALGRDMTGIYIEDWMPETQEEFLTALKNAKEEMEKVSSQNGEAGNRKKVMFTDAEGRLVERSFEPEEEGIGMFLKNAIQEAMEEFGDSMDTGQKVAVLVEVLEEITK